MFKYKNLIPHIIKYGYHSILLFLFLPSMDLEEAVLGILALVISKTDTNEHMYLRNILMWKQLILFIVQT